MKARTKTGAGQPVCCPQQSSSGLVVDPAQEQNVRIARSMTNGDVNALVTRRYLGSGAVESCSLAALAQRSTADAEAVGRGDFSTPEGMLMGQAQALQSMFADLALKAAGQGTLEGRQVLTALALKCASQSRQSLTALADLRNPGMVTFTKQANISSGALQVVNGDAHLSASVRAGNPQTSPNELLETSNGIRMVTRATAAAGDAHSKLAAVEAEHRADLGGG